MVAHQEHFNWDKIKEKLGIDEIKWEENHPLWWPFQTFMEEADFENPNQVKKLHQEERTKLVKEIAYKLIDLIKLCDAKLLPSEDSR